MTDFVYLLDSIKGRNEFHASCFASCGISATYGFVCVLFHLGVKVPRGIELSRIDVLIGTRRCAIPSKRALSRNYTLRIRVDLSPQKGALRFPRCLTERCIFIFSFFFFTGDQKAVHQES